MSLIIRLTKMGKKGERKFRVAVAEKRSRRDGNAVEILGWYEKGVQMEKKKIDTKRYDYWISKGAKPSEKVAKLMA